MKTFLQNLQFHEKTNIDLIKAITNDSGTPPFDHPVNMATSSFRSLYSEPNKSLDSHFFKESLKYAYSVNTARVLWRLGDWIYGIPLIINSRYEFSPRMKSLSWAVQRLHACSLILDARKSISKRGVLCFHLTQSLNLRKRVDLRSKIYTSFKLSLSINIIIFCREYCFLEARVPLFEFTGYNVLYQKSPPKRGTF